MAAKRASRASFATCARDRGSHSEDACAAPRVKERGRERVEWQEAQGAHVWVRAGHPHAHRGAHQLLKRRRVLEKTLELSRRCRHLRRGGGGQLQAHAFAALGRELCENLRLQIGRAVSAVGSLALLSGKGCALGGGKRAVREVLLMVRALRRRMRSPWLSRPWSSSRLLPPEKSHPQGRFRPWQYRRPKSKRLPNVPGRSASSCV